MTGSVLSYRRDGYAFPMALAAIIIITLVIGVAASQVQRAIETFSRQTEAFELQTEARSAEQTFLYLALTNPMGNLGIEIGGDTSIERMFTSGTPGDTNNITLLRANGHARGYGENSVIRYLDQQAFVDADSLGATGQDDDMTLIGISPIRHSSLGAALRDFQDDDNRRTPGGAESSAYDREGLPPNRPINDPVELCNVAGWSEENLCRDLGRLLLLAMPRATGQMSPRLASPFLLAEMTGSNESAARAHAAFETGTFSQFADVGRPEFDTITDIFEVPTGATGKFALVVHDRPAQNAWISVYELTPRNVRAPFSLAYRYRIGGQYVRDALGIPANEPIEPLPDTGQ